MGRSGPRQYNAHASSGLSIAMNKQRNIYLCSPQRRFKSFPRNQKDTSSSGEASLTIAAQSNSRVEGQFHTYSRTLVFAVPQNWLYAIYFSITSSTAPAKLPAAEARTQPAPFRREAESTAVNPSTVSAPPLARRKLGRTKAGRAIP